MSVHTWEYPERYLIWILNQANQKDWPNKTQKKFPIKITQTTRVRLSDSLWVCLFLLLINTVLVSLLSVFVGIRFLQSKRARALSLTTGVMVRICSHCHNMTSVSGLELKPCFRLSQARDQLFSVLNLTKLQLHRRCISGNYSQKTIIVKYKKKTLLIKNIATGQWKTKIQKKI